MQQTPLHQGIQKESRRNNSHPYRTTGVPVIRSPLQQVCCEHLKWMALIGLFANDVIIIGSVRVDWPAPFNVTIGNPRADKRGRNIFECIWRRMQCNIENYRMLHLQRWLEYRGIKRSGTKSLFKIISHYYQSCMCRQEYVIRYGYIQ